MKTGDRVTGDRRREAAGAEPPVSRLLSSCLLLSCLLILTSCAALRREPPRPGRTTLASPLVLLPAESIGNYLLIEGRIDKNGPYRFLIDTGSSISLIAPALARRQLDRNEPLPAAQRIRVTGADGHVTELPPTTLRRLDLGEARFEDVPALIYDCSALSAHLGMKVDGVLGFPLFRETLLTLDYPGSRVLLQSARTDALVPGTIVGFDDARKTPVIQVRLGNRSIVSLIDSGSDATFSLNPIGLEAQYAVPPRTGSTVSTITGDRPQQVARLAESVSIGNYGFERPIVDLTDELSTIGGGMLRYFSVTFDQERNRATFYRQSREPITMAPRRSAGLSFSKTPAYWKVAGVVPGSPAAAAGIHLGDLITRINGEPVARWDLRRYEQLLASTGDVAFTLLNGASESEPQRVQVFELVP